MPSRIEKEAALDAGAPAARALILAIEAHKIERHERGLGAAPLGS
jgi:hypothetical protein